MYIKLYGEATQEKSKYRYGCEIKAGDDSYIACVVSNKREVNVIEDQRVILSSEYICDNLFQKFFSCGYFRFFNEENLELFQIRPTSVLAISFKICLDGKEYKIPRRNTFELNSLGFKIITEKGMFSSTIDKKYKHIGLLLSYFCWLRQQIWNNLG